MCATAIEHTRYSPDQKKFKDIYPFYFRLNTNTVDENIITALPTIATAIVVALLRS